MKKIGSFILLSLFFGAPAFAIETNAKFAYMVDTSTNTVLLNKGAHEKMAPSSMSKLMTTYIVFDKLKKGELAMDDTFKVSEKAWRMQGSKSFVKLDSEVTIKDLLMGVVVQSGNDACIVLAEGISGSEEEFVKLMNSRAHQLGLFNSNFVNATGWPDEGHEMSAHDLALLAQKIIEEFPEYYEYYSAREFTFNNIKQYNRNRLLMSDLPVDGLKTGHTEVAGYGITLSAKQDDRRLILVINGLDSDDARVSEGDKLLRWGFNSFTNKTIVKTGQKMHDAEVWFGSSKTVPLIAKEDMVATLPVAVGPDSVIDYGVRFKSPIKAPIKKGDAIAQLVVRVEGLENQTIPLVAAMDVEQLSGFAKAKAMAKYLIQSLQDGAASE